MPLLIRRGRRTDFTAVMALLAATGSPVPPPDRQTLRRFRGVVADLGTDFYLALADGTLAGLVHVTYARQLAGRQRAQLDQLLVGMQFRRRGIGTSLLGFARRRAEKRGCDELCCVDSGVGAGRSFLVAGGLHAAGELMVAGLLPERGSPTLAGDHPKEV